jgi:hypothetical protein
VQWYKGRRHYAAAVYLEMFLQICKDYHVLPDPDRMTLDDIVLYYDGGRASLHRATKPQ